MKIGIVTLYDDNFGTCLQAFGLMKAIEKLGHDAYIIKYIRANRPSDNESKLLHIIERIRKLNIRTVILYFGSHRFISRRKAAFASFRKTNLVFYNTQFYRDDNYTILNQFDKIVCGSDMIWSEEFYDDWDYLYLGFAERDKSVAYAPSFGKNEISQEHRAKCKDLLGRIGTISCREPAGVRLIEEIADIKAQRVLDPTLLLSRAEWNSLINEDRRMIDEPYTLTYVFGGIDGIRSDFFKAFTEKGLGRHVVLPMNQKQDDNEKLQPLGPFEFVRLFRDAEYIITDTFHGMIFSIIMNKPFLVLEREDKGNWAKYSDRMTSTLDSLGLIDYYVNSSFRDFDKTKNINYDAINCKLDELKNLSITYLKNALREG